MLKRKDNEADSIWVARNSSDLLESLLTTKKKSCLVWKSLSQEFSHSKNSVPCGCQLMPRLLNVNQLYPPLTWEQIIIAWPLFKLSTSPKSLQPLLKNTFVHNGQIWSIHMERVLMFLTLDNSIRCDFPFYSKLSMDQWVSSVGWHCWALRMQPQTHSNLNSQASISKP